MQIDYLRSLDGRVHAINCKKSAASIEIGILCLIAYPESTCRISSEHHHFTVDIPKELRSGSERVKGFNITLTVLDHEQIQLPSQH
jgi:hypothetical protein